ncbi:MAG: FRG domain-containing protein [Deltaproteobacteria bacterium]|nr:FRG domain-containing protein [Deltaproteobacteria bacterium]
MVVSLPGKITDRPHGQKEVRLNTWTEFNEVVTELLDYPHYVFRGHRINTWLLEPTLTRKLKQDPAKKEKTTKHLEHFRYAIRGRRGPNPPDLKDDDALWALGQHNGLSTPLLDWTASPYVALFFAFSEEDDTSSKTDTRIVWMLNKNSVTDKSDELEKLGKTEELITFFNPLSDENARLLSQSGLFSKCSGFFEIKSWIEQHFPPDQSKVTLVRIEIPNDDRVACLKSLARMNINHASLFPDLYGACMNANMKLEIPQI